MACSETMLLAQLLHSLILLPVLTGFGLLAWLLDRFARMLRVHGASRWTVGLFHLAAILILVSDISVFVSVVGVNTAHALQTCLTNSQQAPLAPARGLPPGAIGERRSTG